MKKAAPPPRRGGRLTRAGLPSYDDSHEDSTGPLPVEKRMTTYEHLNLIAAYLNLTASFGGLGLIYYGIRVMAKNAEMRAADSERKHAETMADIRRREEDGIRRHEEFDDQIRAQARRVDGHDGGPARVDGPQARGVDGGPAANSYPPLTGSKSGGFASRCVPPSLHRTPMACKRSFLTRAWGVGPASSPARARSARFDTNAPFSGLLNKSPTAKKAKAPLSPP